MNTQLLRVIAVVAAASVVASCEQLTSWRYTKWKCFNVDRTTSPPPHADQGDQYCVVTRGQAPNLQWLLDPGRDMSNWKAIGGGSRIPLVVVDDTATVKSWEFEVDITDHQPSDHGHEHKKPGRGYLLEVNIPANTAAKAQAEIKVSVPLNDTIHNGTAHSVEF